MKNPFFSIVIPTKNRSFLVKYALESVLNQTFKDYEVIVVDNDDSNDTYEVISKYSSDKIKYIRTGNLNMADNWEMGVSAAKGRFVTILEDKQAFKLHALDEIYSSIEKYKGEVVTWIFDGFHDDEKFINRIYGSGKESIVKTEKILEMMRTESFVYKQCPLPRAINAFISSEILAKIKSKLKGKIFFQIAPDYGLAFSVLALSDSVIHIERALSVFGSPNIGTGASGLKRSELAKTFQKDYIKKYGSEEIFYNAVPIKSSWISFSTIWNDYNNTRERLGGNLISMPMSKPNYYFTCLNELKILENNGNDISVELAAYKKAFDNEPVEVKEKLAQLLNGKEPDMFPVKFSKENCEFKNIMEFVYSEEEKRLLEVNNNYGAGSVIHFVYSGDPLNDNAIVAPGTITNKLYRYLQKFREVKYYDLKDKTSNITVNPNDIIIGHPHPEEETAIKRLFRHNCAGKYLLFPLHTKIPEINHFIHDVAQQADNLFVISGPYWTETIGTTEFKYLREKIIRLDNGLDLGSFPLKKNRFNSSGKRGLFVYGRSGEEKGTKLLFNLLQKFKCRVVIAGNYIEEDIALIKNRPDTSYLGNINLSNQKVVKHILENCDFFINMSVSDASPTTLLETMSLGLIPITTPQCGYYYSSFLLLSLSDNEHNILTINNALNMDEEHLKLLQNKNLNIIEQNHNWDKFCEKVGRQIFQLGNKQPKIKNEKKRIKVAADYESDKSLTQIDSISEFAKQITKVIADIKPSKIIETGTFHGTGTTKIIGNAVKTQGLINTKFYSIEVNINNYKEAQKNIAKSGLGDYVTLLNGLSLPRNFLPTIEDIEKRTVKNIEFDEVFVDHREGDRARMYYNETDFADVEDSLLEQCLISFDYEPDFVLLDSGGHIGNIEFNYLLERLNKECIIALDDVNHIKHKKSLMQMMSDSRFKIIIKSDEKFGFCIAKFTPDSKYEKPVLSLNGFKPKNILFIRTDSIGDNVLASSMLKSVKNKYGDAQITILCQNHVAELYQFSPYLDEIITLDKQRIYVDESYKTSVIKSIRDRHFDIVINSVYSSERITDLLAFASGAEKIVRIDGNAVNSDTVWANEARKSASHTVMTGAGWQNELARYKELLAGINAENKELKPEIWLSQNDKDFANKFYSDNRLEPDKTIVLFAGALNDHRLYYKYGKALSDICKSNGYNVVAVGSENDFEINQANLNDIEANTINISGKTTILQTAAIIQRCLIAVGAETGNAHIACAVGTPNVVLIGGGHFGRFMPYSHLTSLFLLPLDCYGCNWKCDHLNYKCIKSLEPDLLKFAIEKTLQNNSGKIRIFTQGNKDINTVTRLLNLNNYEIIPLMVDILLEAENFIESKDFNKAIEILTRIAENDPSNLDALIDLAVAHSLQGDNDIALNLLNHILILDPENKIAKNNLELINNN